MGSRKISLSGTDLSLEDVYELSHAPLQSVNLTIDPAALKRMYSSRSLVMNMASQDKAFYGINTGFGPLAETQISPEDLSQLQVNLIRSHAAGVGQPFSRQMTRAIMLLRANCLVQGYSGINPEIVELLLTFFNEGIHPLIPQKGSLGASGDLAPLSHLALGLIGEGEVEFQGTVMPAQEALLKIGKKPAILGPKDGLALNNGTAVMLALGATAFVQAKRLMKMADLISALTVDVMKASQKPFAEAISRLKPHPGQLASAQNLRNFLVGSEIMNAHHDCKRVQDPYSLRCIPQVHGACRQTLTHAEVVLTTELQSVTDNPLVFAEEEQVISGGNFHGEALALCLDYLAMGLAEMASISERRIDKMMNPHFSDLPSFLTKNAGLNSGMMIAHYTMASLVSENKVLCHPASVDSIPTSIDKEDHVSMGLNSALKLQQILENAITCLGTELLCNTHALDLVRPFKTSPLLEKVYEEVRKIIEPLEEDRVLAQDIQKIGELVKGGFLLEIIGECH